jgi:hypothetical protein
MNVSNETVSIVTAILSGKVGEVVKVVDTILDTLSLSQKEALKSIFVESGVCIRFDKLDESVSELPEMTAAYLLLHISHDHSGVLIQFAENFWQKNRSVELDSWEHLSDLALKDWLYLMSDKRLAKKYWILTSVGRHGDNSEFEHISVSECAVDDLHYASAENARDINAGRFEAEMYGVPCFDSDGFITYPKSFGEIDYFTYKKFSEYVNVYEFSGIDEENECIVDFLKAA